MVHSKNRNLKLKNGKRENKLSPDSLKGHFHGFAHAQAQMTVIVA